MTERDTTRFLAWSNELREVHNRLRKALRLVEGSLETDNPTTSITTDLLLYCRGFCVALTQHHRGEDRRLLPAIEAEHPELAPVLRKLEQDHSWIDTGAFNDELEQGGHLVFAEGLTAPYAATLVDGQGDSPVITDGPYINAKEYLGGF